MKELTQKQRAVLSFIVEYIHDHTYPPTIREIAEQYNISVKGAYDHIKALKKKGCLKMGERRSRSMEVLKRGGDQDGEAVMEVRVLGTIAAGRPILAEENWEGSLPIHRSLLRKGRNYFALKVRGDSMVDAGIRDGDMAIIEQQETAQDGEIVAAQIEDSATLKRFFRESSRVRLQPENVNYTPIYTQDVRILGRLAHIFRSY